MRVTLADASLARSAGRFVWLDLNFDSPANQAFLARHPVTFTPTFFVIDPADGRAIASRIGGMTLSELNGFFDRGEKEFGRKAGSPADAALARGDAAVGKGHWAEAAAAYGDALRLSGPGWPERNRDLGSLTWSMRAAGQARACAEKVAAEAPHMRRDASFGRVVLAGFMALNDDMDASWSKAIRPTLEPLALEAIELPATQRDHRFQLYQQLMSAAQHRNDAAEVERWGDRWLREIDATVPVSDDERSALDIARVDAADLMGKPARVLPALTASAQAMPDNYNAWLRLAQMQVAAGRDSEAVAACDRGLRHVTGPVGQTWLLTTKANALDGKGDKAAVRRVLQEALKSARRIGSKSARERNVRKIQRALDETDHSPAQ